MCGARSAGSSPLTRGKRVEARGKKLALRLIPAHAGKTASCTGPRVRSWAHPRSRGENIETFGGGNTMSGSSPLTRGKQVFSAHGLRRRGLIPAHAGKTQAKKSTSTHHQAHPRSRGENINVQKMPLNLYGSSPLTRGKPRAGRPRHVPVLIPAHAGKTNRPALRGRSWAAHPRSRGENMVTRPM